MCLTQIKRKFCVAILLAALPTSLLAQDDKLVQDTCMQIAKRLSSVQETDCRADNKLALTGQSSVEGRPILQKEYPPVESKVPKARVLMIGGIHADELTSISIVFNWMRILNKEHTGQFHWKVIPLLNPDGLFRKESTRVNARGVDLNRNFPAPNWNKFALDDYWIKQTNRNPRRYPGPSALSEPETMWLAEEIERFKPDAIVSVHAPYGIVDFDGPPEGPSKLGRLYLNPLGTFPGSLGNYAGIQKNIPVVTIELKHAGIMPQQVEVNKIWADMFKWLDEHIPKDTPPIFNGVQPQLEVTDKPKLEMSPKLTVPVSLNESKDAKKL